MRVAASHQAEAEKIAAELAAIARSGMILPGSITDAAPAAAAATAPATPTRPACTAPTTNGPARSPRKTIGRWLTPDQHRDYQPWIDNDRRLRELLARLEALGTAAFEADPRWNR